MRARDVLFVTRTNGLCYLSVQFLFKAVTLLLFFVVLFLWGFFCLFFFNLPPRRLFTGKKFGRNAPLVTFNLDLVQSSTEIKDGLLTLASVGANAQQSFPTREGRHREQASDFFFSPSLSPASHRSEICPLG